ESQLVNRIPGGQEMQWRIHMGAGVHIKGDPGKTASCPAGLKIPFDSENWLTVTAVFPNCHSGMDRHGSIIELHITYPLHYLVFMPFPPIGSDQEIGLRRSKRPCWIKNHWHTASFPICGDWVNKPPSMFYFVP